MEADTASSSPIAQAGAGFDVLALARNAGRRDLRFTLAVQILRIVFRLSFSASLAWMVGRLVMQQAVEPWMVVATVILLLLSSASALAADLVQAEAEIRLADVVRAAATDRLQDMQARQLQSRQVGTLVISLQRHPDAVAALVIAHRSAHLMMAIGPLIAAAMLVVVSWQAAALVLSLTPVMIIFFVLVGDAIRRRADRQEQACGRLAGQFADRLRTLPTILANHALLLEQAKLTDRLETYSAKTMGVLRIAFANAAIIDFFASLSIAMLAVFLGLGHLKLAMIPGFSDLVLWQSLFILIVAPEFFAPFRRFSEQYHAKADGQSAAAALDKLLIAVNAPAPDVPSIDDLHIALPAHGLVAIIGPSGSGKSTLLRRIAGLELGQGEIGERLVSWISTDSHVSGRTLRQAIVAHGDIGRDSIEDAAQSVGLLSDALLAGGLDAPVGRSGEDLSGGQRLRIAIVRAMLSDRIVLADEPTAKLDAETAGAVRRALLVMAHSRLVVAATHDREIVRSSDSTIDLSPINCVEAAA